MSTGAEALALAREQRRFNLVITTLQRRRHERGRAGAARRAPPASASRWSLLAFDNRELTDFLARHDLSAVERVFLWQGDARILLAIVKYVEDRRTSSTTPARRACRSSS